MFEYLNTNKVYYAGMTRSYTEEVAKVADNSEYCVGWIGDLGGETGVNFATGYNLAQVLADEGCKKIAVVGATEGETMNDERIMGIEAKAAETGMEIIARYRGADFNTGYADILSGYGTELDGIICTGGGDNGVAAIMAAGYAGRIKLVQVDEASEATKEYLEAGLLNATYAGGSTYIVSMYMQLFNALSGADRLFDEGSKIFPQFSGFIVTSAEEYDDASIYTTGEGPSGLLPDEILLMNSLAAPGLSIPEREQAIRDMMSIDYWNIVDIRERVSTYLSE
jgi:hypothetical protein